MLKGGLLADGTPNKDSPYFAKKTAVTVRVTQGSKKIWILRVNNISISCLFTITHIINIKVPILGVIHFYQIVLCIDPNIKNNPPPHINIWWDW